MRRGMSRWCWAATSGVRPLGSPSRAAMVASWVARKAWAAIRSPTQGRAACLHQHVAVGAGGHRSRRVRAGVIGMAGGGALADPQVRESYDAALARVWAQRRTPGIARGDLKVAFAAGTESPAGGVLVAGTGSVAGRVVARRLTATVGGHGWLLGDEGSGFWLGREAVRLAFATLRVWHREACWSRG